jgi:O-methyltransferase
MNLLSRLQQSRWRWFVEGLPSISRAVTLFRVRRYTMTSTVRCKHLWAICNQLLDENVPGNFVECGVWRGGSAAIMGLALKRAGANRMLHLFDSFEGLPEPTSEDGAYAAEYSGGRSSGALKTVGQCRSELPEVKEFLFSRLGLDPTSIAFHVGWFQETIPGSAGNVGPIAILRLDGDWYESTRICLEHLYPLIVPSGVVILDDYYAWEGCAKAADEFRSRFSITVPVERIDRDAAFWRVRYP